MTGSGANLLAVSLLTGAYSSVSLIYSDWLVAAFPLAMILLLIGWFVGVKIIFPLKPEEKQPQIQGGMERLRQEELRREQERVEREQVAQVTGTNKDEEPAKKDPVRKMEKKVYPNDPCPCGSGKKYKKCCGASRDN